MSKLFQDTLMIDGKFSRLNLTWFVAVLMMVGIGISLTVITYLQPDNKLETVLEVFKTFAWLVFGLSGIAIGNKLANTLTTPKDDQQ
jgi:type IV secretory pathway component VirB8